jgi:hypothetical protein
MNSLTEAEKNLLARFGFLINGSVVTHKKLEMKKDISWFQGYDTLEELERQIKTMLRSQCKLGRSRSLRG